MKKSIFVSSTFIDLIEHRKAVQDAIRQLGAIDISMENFGARDKRPKDECIRLITEESDIFIGIYAHRYGIIPDGETISITEAEYNAASSARLPRLIYLIDESKQLFTEHVDEGESSKKLHVLKQRLITNHTCGFFSNKDELAAKVAVDLGRYFLHGTLPTSIGHRGLFYRPTQDWISPLSKNKWRFKVVAFDFDGTLLRGDKFQFSWEAVWNGLGFSKGIQTELKREYRRKAQKSDNNTGRIQAYREWCQKACDYFIARKLTRRELSNFIRPLKVTRNLNTTINRLREEGFVLAIISGGINSFLEDKISDYKTYFDYVFINELKFYENGFLYDVIPTEFDFEGKADALKYVCDQAGCTLEESVFVGDGFNDESIMLAANRAIAYPPRDQSVEGVSQISINEDNLELILPYICIE